MLELLLLIFTIHLIADYPLQLWVKATKGKQEHLKPLLIHGAIYATVLMAALVFPLGWRAAALYGAGNALIHIIIDAGTSRLSHRYFYKNEMKKFFLVLGIDQYLHTVTLILSLYLIV